MSDASAPSCRDSSVLSFGQALAVCAVATIACGVWLYAAGQRLQPGAARLLAAAPVVAACLMQPLLFCRWEECIAIMLISFNTTWLSTFKAISWALDRGALCMQRFTLPQFLAVYASPITPVVADPAVGSAAAAAKARSAAKAKSPGGSSNGSLLCSATANGSNGGSLPHRGSKGRLDEDAGGVGTMVAAWLGKHLFVLVLVWLLRFDLPELLESLVLGLSLYALLSLIMDGPAALAIGLTGVRVSPHFDEPWRSTSVAAFWSKRWDLAAGNTLRQLVYDCVVDGSLLPLPPGKQLAPPSAVRQLLGMTASFATSGLVHEVIFWYIAGHTTHGVWFAFFFIQAPLIVAERLFLSALKRRGVALPNWVRTAITALLVVGSGQHLFWGPSKWYGVTDAVVHNTRAAALAALQSLGISLDI